MTMQSARIFVVEGETPTATELEGRLGRLGYTVCGTAARGETAIAQIAAAKPDLVLMDVNLAGELTGIETAARLHMQYDMPVVYLTAFPDDAMLRQATATEPFGYLVKPFAERELHATIQMALYKRRMEQRLADANAQLEEKVRDRTAALAASEALTRHLLSASPAVIFSAEFGGGYRTAFVSENVASVLGYAPEAFTGDAGFWASRIHPADAPNVLAELPKLLERDTHSHEYRFRHKNGEWRWMHEDLTLVRDPDGNPREIVGSWTDVTAHREAEERLLDAQRNARIGSWQANLRTGEIAWSPTVFDIFGRDPSRFAPSIAAVDETVHPDDVQRVRGSEQRAIAAGKHDMMYRIVRPDGEVRYLHELAHVVADGEGRPAWLVGTVQDVTERETATKEMEHARNVLESVIENVPAMIFMKRADDLRFVRFNRAGETLLGYSRHDLLGKNDYDFFPKEQADFFTAADRDVLASSEIKQIVEEPIRTKSGELRYLRTSKIALRDADGRPTHLLGISIDITDQRKAERALVELNATLEQRLAERTAAVAESEQRLARALRLAKVGHWVWTGPPYAAWTAGTIEYSETVAEIFGVPTKELTVPDAEYIERFVHPEDRERVQAAFENYKERRKLRTPLEYRIRRPDGTIRHIVEISELVAGDPDHPTDVMGTIHDVTALHEARARLAVSERVFASLAEASPVGIFRTDAEGNCEYVNRRWCEIAGLSEAEARGEGWAGALHPADRERVFEEWSESARSRKPFRSEYRFKRPDGMVRWVIGQSEQIADAAGRIVGHIGTLTDFTELKESELALRAREDQLQRSQQMAHIGHWTWRADRVAGPWHTGLRYSPAAAAIFGVSPEELAVSDTEYLSRYVHPDDRPSLSQIYGDDKAPPPHGRPIEYRILRKDGSVRHLVEIIEETYAEGDTAREVQGMVQDITEQAGLRHHLAQAQQIAELGSWEWDIDTGRLFWSDQVFRICGFDPADTTPTIQLLDSIIHPEDLDRLVAEFDKAIAARSRYEGYFRIIRHDGALRWLYEIGEPVADYGGTGRRFAGIVMDVTAQKLAEVEREAAIEQLRLSEERFSTLFYASPLSVLVATYPDGKITDVNDAYSQVFGFERSEVIGKTTTELGLWADPQDRQAMLELLRKDKRIRGMEFTFRTRSGDRRTLLMSIEIVQIAGQAHSLAMSIDITERKRIDRAMQALSSDLMLLEGQVYFEAAARRLSELLDTELAVVARLDPARPDEIRTVALIEDGTLLPNINHPVAGTPCIEVIKGHACMVAAGAGQRYPTDALLAGKLIEAYAGEPLDAQGGQPLGMVCVMSRKPFKDPATVATILKMFGVAITAAMTREQVHRRDAWLRAILENAPTEIVLKDRDLRFMAVSKNIAEARGSTMTAVIGKTTRDFFAPEIADIYEAADRKVIETGEIVQQEVKEAEDGVFRYIHNAKFPLRDAAGEIIGIGSLSTEFTETKRIEMAMQAISTDLIALEGPAYFNAAARQLAKLLDADLAFVTRLDPQRPGELRVVAMVEDGAQGPEFSYPVAGTPCANVIGGRAILVASGAREQYPEDRFFAEKSIEAYAGEPLRDNSGRTLGHVGVMIRRPFRDAAAVATMLKIFGVAISAAMMRERNRRQYEDLFEFAPSALVMIDKQGRIALANQQAEQIFGWSREELAGQPVEMLVPPEFRAGHVRLREYFQTSAVQRQMAANRPNLRGHRRDGSEFPAEIELAPMASEEGIMVAAAIRDITERRALEAQLAQAIKMEAIGKLTGGMAHDFNNYLAVIIGNLDLLGERKAADPAEARLIDAALGGAQRAAELTQSLLAFSRRQPLDPRIIDINRNIDGVARLLKRTLGEDLALTTDFAPDLWPVRIDGAQLDSCIVNLANNARDAMPRGGALVIATRNAELDEIYAAANDGVAAGDYALIEVSDTGEGMTPEIAARVFEPFFTTKGPGHGTGLGLSMVYGFVKQSGGHVKIYSEPGHGTTVRLYLPRADAADDVDEVPAAADAAAQMEGAGTVLVVEDNADMREAALAQLTSLGYQAVAAADGEAALAILERGEPRVDLLFSDVVMPGTLDGYALATAALERRPALKVLLTSGFPGDTLRHHDKHKPNLRLLGKPYRKQELARAIRATLTGEAVTPKRSG